MSSTMDDHDGEKEQPAEWRINLKLEKVPAPKETDYLKPFMLRFDANKVGWFKFIAVLSN